MYVRRFGTHAFVELSLIIMKFSDGHFVRLFTVQSGADGASVEVIPCARACVVACSYYFSVAVDPPLLHNGSGCFCAF